MLTGNVFLNILQSIVKINIVLSDNNEENKTNLRKSKKQME
jgi:hypothetical protein